ESIEQRDVQLTAVGDKAVFNGFDDRTGFEPWVSDGTEGGTGPLADIAPGTLGSIASYGSRYIVAGSSLFFVANDQTHGEELFCVPLAALTHVCGGDCDGSGRVSIDELTLGISIALRRASLERCASMDVNHDQTVSIDDLVEAVNNALRE